MVVTQVRAKISKPAHKIFSYLRNFENLPQYNSSVLFAKWKDSTQLICTLKIGLSILNFEGEYEILEVIENQKIVARCETSLIEFEDSYEIFELENEAEVVITDRTILKGFLALSEGILKPNMKREMEANMKTLKKILEQL